MKKVYFSLIIICFFSNGIFSQNVGIGTSTPLMRLHVSKTDSAVALFENTQSLNTNVSNAIYFKTGNGSYPYTGAVKTIGQSSTTARLGFFTYSSLTANGLLERMSITDNGYTGIGTTTPQTDLHINPNGAGSLLIGTNKTTGGYTNIEMGISTQSNGYGYVRATKSSGSGYGDLILNPTQGDVGIGTVAPTSRLDVNGNIITEGGAGGFRFIDRSDNAKSYQWYSSNGNAFLFRHHSPAGNVISVYENGKMILNPSGGNVGINFYDATDLEFPLDINQTNGLYGLRLRNNNYAWDLYTSSNSANLFFSFNGANYAFISSYNGGYVAISDARFKKNINTMPAVLDRVMELQARTYQFKNQKETDKTSTGFIAQEVMPLFPELVEDFKYPTKDTTDKNIYHGLNYAGFSVIAIKAIQEQQNEIDLLKEGNKVMIEGMIKLKAEIETLKQKIK